jgi:hypothetical protein
MFVYILFMLEQTEVRSREIGNMIYILTNLYTN